MKRNQYDRYLCRITLPDYPPDTGYRDGFTAAEAIVLWLFGMGLGKLAAESLKAGDLASVIYVPAAMVCLVYALKKLHAFFIKDSP